MQIYIYVIFSNKNKKRKEEKPDYIMTVESSSLTIPYDIIIQLIIMP